MITTTLGGSPAVGGSGFDVTLTVYDADGNMKTDFIGAHNVDWTISGANDAPDTTGPTLPADGSMTFTAGAVTYSGMVLVNGTDSVEIRALLTAEGVYEDTPVTETENSGVETAGIDFTVTVTVFDVYGNIADHGVNDYDGLHTIDFTSTATASPNLTSPTIPTAIALTFSGGAVTTNSGTDPFTLVNAGEAPTITATDNAAPAVNGVSDTITVDVNPVIASIRINTGTIGNTAEVTAFTVTTDNFYLIHGSRYDAYGNYISDVAAASTWDATGDYDIGDVVGTPGVGVSFEPDNTGTAGTITIDDPYNGTGAADDATGNITVNAGAINY
ncbi:hypothetical protein LCGC14_1990250, partial [marine sediment metagenome]